MPYATAAIIQASSAPSEYQHLSKSSRAQSQETVAHRCSPHSSHRSSCATSNSRQTAVAAPLSALNPPPKSSQPSCSHPSTDRTTPCHRAATSAGTLHLSKPAPAASPPENPSHKSPALPSALKRKPAISHPGKNSAASLPCREHRSSATAGYSCFHPSAPSTPPPHAPNPQSVPPPHGVPRGELSGPSRILLERPGMVSVSGPRPHWRQRPPLPRPHRPPAAALHRRISCATPPSIKAETPSPASTASSPPMSLNSRNSPIQPTPLKSAGATATSSFTPSPSTSTPSSRHPTPTSSKQQQPEANKSSPAKGPPPLPHRAHLHQQQAHPCPRLHRARGRTHKI